MSEEIVRSAMTVSGDFSVTKPANPKGFLRLEWYLHFSFAMRFFFFFLIGCLPVHSVSAQSTTFNFTGGVQTYTVPDCVNQIEIVAAGGKGGGGANGGNGATVTGVINVVPGQVLEVRVGGQGSCPGAGFNGGGSGHATSLSGQNSSCGGGGASDVRVAPYAMANRVIVAAGGGGRNGGSNNNLVSGGAGGCANGANGQGSVFTITGGVGGSQTNGGAGGPPWGGGGQNGFAGTLGQGGNGGLDASFGASGGGGGGGLYGGGGGGSDGCCTGSNGGGAGGGGSSLTPAGGSCTQGNNNANGYVTITPVGGINVSVLPAAPQICAGQSVALTASGADTYVWSPSTGLSATTGATVTASPTVTTTYTVVGTSGGGACEDDFTVTVTVVPIPVVTVSPANPAACNGDPVTLTASGATTYSWSPAAGLNTTTGATVISNPNQTTTYTVTGTTQGCSGETSVTVAYQVEVSENVQICQGDSYTLANGQTVNSTGQYTATLVSSLGCDSIITTNLTVIPLPTGGISGNNAICPGGTAQLSFNLQGTGPFTYVWSDGVNTFTQQNAQGVSSQSVQPIATTTYTLLAITDSNIPQCQSAPGSTFQVQVAQPVQVNLTPQISGCAGSCTGSISAAVSGGIGNMSLQWTGPSGVFGGNQTTVNQLCPGDYSVIAIDGIGCQGSGAVTVGEVPQLAIQSLTTNNPLCSAGCTGGIVVNAPTASSFTLTGTQTSGNTVNLQGTAANQTTIGQLCGGDYSLTLTSSFGCVVNQNFTLTAPPALTAQINGAATVCAGQEITLTAQSAGGTGNVNFTWSPGGFQGNTLTLTPGVTTPFVIIATDANGCTVTSPAAMVTVIPPLTAVAGPNSNICAGDQVTLSAGGTGGSGGPFVYSWSSAGQMLGNQQTLTVSPTISTSYSVSVSDQCNTSFAQVTVTVNPIPSGSFTVTQQKGCVPHTATFIPGPGENAVSCYWDFGNGQTTENCDSLTVTYNSQGCYDVVAIFQSAAGCISTVMVNDAVCVYPNPVVDFTWDPKNPTTENTVVEFTNLTPNSVQTLWNLAGEATSILPNPTHEFPNIQAGIYTVCLTVVNNNGCVGETCQVLTIDNAFAFWAPTGFTPDNNDLNETFRPIVRGHDPNDYWFAVFNRWGEKVFETNDYLQGWNGSHQGSNFYVEPEVYTWRVVVKELGVLDKHIFKGHVMLVR